MLLMPGNTDRLARGLGFAFVAAFDLLGSFLNRDCEDSARLEIVAAE